MPAEAWADFCRFRRGKTWTPKAQELCLRDLGKLRDEGQDPVAVIEQSIRNGWRGLFAVKDQRNGAPMQRQSNLAWMREGFAEPVRTSPTFDLDLTATEIPQ